MIREVAGDILLTKAQALAHGVAPNDSFSQGLALALRERWPSLHKDFRHYCHNKHPKVGEAWVWGTVGGLRIINLLTQEGGYEHGSRPGKATLENVNHCMKALKKQIESEGIQSLALPRLATGVGGLDWEDVKPLIYKHLQEFDIPVVIYTTYRPGQQADEGWEAATEP